MAVGGKEVTDRLRMGGSSLAAAVVGWLPFGMGRPGHGRRLGREAGAEEEEEGEEGRKVGKGDVGLPELLRRMPSRLAGRCVCMRASHGSAPPPSASRASGPASPPRRARAHWLRSSPRLLCSGVGRGIPVPPAAGCSTGSLPQTLGAPGCSLVSARLRFFPPPPQIGGARAESCRLGWPRRKSCATAEPAARASLELVSLTANLRTTRTRSCRPPRV